MNFKRLGALMVGLVGVSKVDRAIDHYYQNQLEAIKLRQEKKQETKEEKKRAFLYNNSDNAADKDPELYNAFLTIKKDYEITEDIPLRILHQKSHIDENEADLFNLKNMIKDSYAFYSPSSNTIFLQQTYHIWEKPTLIHYLAHELEHARQQLQKFGSYNQHSDTSGGMNFKAEIGADAAAADYQYCHHCLRKTAQQNAWPHDPKETDWGYLTTKEGYFSDQDYQLYIDRACQENAVCKAHTQSPNANENTPLEHYLPPTPE